MIVIKVEIWPWGLESKKRKLGEMRIWNDASGTKKIGNYGFKISGKNNRKMNEGEFKGFKRLNRHVWDLIMECLNIARKRE